MGERADGGGRNPALYERRDGGVDLGAAQLQGAWCQRARPGIGGERVGAGAPREMIFDVLLKGGGEKRPIDAFGRTAEGGDRHRLEIELGELRHLLPSQRDLPM